MVDGVRTATAATLPTPLWSIFHQDRGEGVAQIFHQDYSATLFRSASSGEDFTSCFDKDYALGGAADYGHGDHGSATVNTAWALLGLVSAGHVLAWPSLDSAESQPDRLVLPGLPEAAARGAVYLMSRQSADGDWPQEGITGVFNRWRLPALLVLLHPPPTLGLCVFMISESAVSIRLSVLINRACGITYTQYRNVFPIWALGRYATEL